MYLSIRKSGGDLKLLQLSDKLENLMVMTKLLTVFDTYKDEAQALQSFH
jgi:anti-sigma B factor antagonist